MMDQPVSIEFIVDSIPPSTSDELLRSWGYDLVTEYVQILREAHLDATTPLLELATGSGRMSAVLTRLGFNVVTGDISHEKHADVLGRITPAFSDRVDHLVLNMKMLPFPGGRFKNVVCLDTLHELQEPDVCVSELIRVHDPGGTIILGDFNDLGFDVMQRLHQAVYRNDHPRGFLKMAELRLLLQESYDVIHETVTPLNISYTAAHKKTLAVSA
jgi:ubiquinone/menaquinone biosynthesis C-methylase UbiE